MQTVYTFIFIIACVSFVLCMLCYGYYTFKCHFYLRKYFPDFIEGRNSVDIAVFNTKKYRDYILVKGITTETTNLKRYLNCARISILLAVLSSVLAFVFDVLRRIN